MPTGAFCRRQTARTGLVLHVGCSNTGFRRRFMDKVPNVVRVSPGRGARAAESDSLLTRATQSSNPGAAHQVRSHLRCRPLRARGRRRSGGVLWTGLWTETKCGSAGLKVVTSRPNRPSLSFLAVAPKRSVFGATAARRLGCDYSLGLRGTDINASVVVCVLNSSTSWLKNPASP